MNIFNVYKNVFERSINRKFYLIFSLGSTIVAMLLAIYFTSKLSIGANIAFVTNSKNVNFKSSVVQVDVLHEKIKESELFSGKYDAEVIDEGRGKFKIETFKSDKFKKAIQSFLIGDTNVKFDSTVKRGVGTNILGFMIMFLFIQAFLFMSLFIEDKQNGTFKRIATTPAGVIKYLMGYSLFNLTINFVPSFLVLLIEKYIFKVNIGFSIGTYICLLMLMSFMATAYSLLLCSLSENHDNCSMYSTTIVIATSLLSGNFYNINGKNYILNNIIKVLPQKNYLDIAVNIENGKAFSDSLAKLTYIIVFNLLLFVIGIMFTQRRFKKGKY